MTNFQSILKPYFQLLVVYLSLTWIVSCGGSSKDELVDTGVQQTLAMTINTYLDTNQKESLPGVSIVVREEGELLYQDSRGMANMLTGDAISENTGFRLASVSKPFTAIAIMQLYEQGQINLDDKLLTFIPELPLIGMI